MANRKCPNCKVVLKIDGNPDRVISCIKCKYMARVADFPLYKTERFVCPQCGREVVLDVTGVSDNANFVCSQCKFRAPLVEVRMANQHKATPSPSSAQNLAYAAMNTPMNGSGGGTQLPPEMLQMFAKETPQAGGGTQLPPEMLQMFAKETPQAGGGTQLPPEMMNMGGNAAQPKGRTLDPNEMMNMGGNVAQPKGRTLDPNEMMAQYARQQQQYAQQQQATPTPNHQNEVKTSIIQPPTEPMTRLALEVVSDAGRWDKSAPRLIYLDEGQNIVGRGDITLGVNKTLPTTDTHLSRKHFEIRVSLNMGKRVIEVKDLNSMNGTRVRNTEQMTVGVFESKVDANRAMVVKVGDFICAGDTILKIVEK